MLRQILPLALLCVAALSGCPNAATPSPYAIADWHVRCDSLMLACTPPPARMVTGYNGMDGNAVSCDVRETATNRVVNFRVGSSAGGTRYSLSLTNATIARSGGFASTGCSVTVEEGANTYRAACGSSAPTPAIPCQVQVTFGPDDTMSGSTVLHAEVLCDHLANATDPTQMRSVYAGAGSMEPGSFELFDCRGLSHGP